MARKRVLTGMRTTGHLHLGHLVGALYQWKAIQDSGQYECYFLIADNQSLTTHDPKVLTQYVREVAYDWMSVGLDPSLPNIHFVLQSQVTWRYALSSHLMSVASYGQLMRNPTLKTELERIENASVSFMVYPVDQAADIYMINPYPVLPGDEVLVPVGADQVPHLEDARDVADKVNYRYGGGQKILTPCTPLVGKVGRLIGTDGEAKMSKSVGNTIDLVDPPDVVTRKVMGMYTDPNHLRVEDPGDADNNPVFVYLRAFDPREDEVEELANHYRKGGLGDVVLKRRLVEVVNETLRPIRQRRQEIGNTPLTNILRSGSELADSLCEPVVKALMERMSLVYPD